LTQYAAREVAVVGPEAREKATRLQRHYVPNAVYIGGTEENLPLLKNKLAEGRTLIYVCEKRVCKLPVEDVQSAVKQLVNEGVYKPVNR
jgi:uncharacterized protein YyaL (SSP411 family)